MSFCSKFCFSLLLLLIAASCSSLDQSLSNSQQTFISNARIVDGTGSQSYIADLRIEGNIISEIGDLELRQDESFVDASGLVLAPRFIDTHSHHDRGLADNRDALPLLSQGITTAVFGQDGSHNYPIMNFFADFENSPSAVNIASYAGHNTLRNIVLGANNRNIATEEQTNSMERLLQTELNNGALGLSSGLEYEPGVYSESEEVLALAHITAAANGRYTSHIRSEDRFIWESVDELIDIGRQTGMPVHYSHMKLAGKAFWNEAESLKQKMDNAREEGINLTADIYPYEYWQSTIEVLLPDRNPDNLEEIEFVLRDIAPADGIIFTRFEPDPSYVGLSIADIARLRSDSEVNTLSNVIKEARVWSASNGGRSSESIMGRSMQEADIEQLMLWSHANFCSDGGYSGHPRGYGSYPRVLANYVREKNLLSLEAAIKKMTLMAASAIGIEDRGTIKGGNRADLVLFDINTIQDHATIQNGQQLSTGVLQVWVNGQIVFKDGDTTNARPGRVIKKIR